MFVSAHPLSSYLDLIIGSLVFTRLHVALQVLVPQARVYYTSPAWFAVSTALKPPKLSSQSAKLRSWILTLTFASPN